MALPTAPLHLMDRLHADSERNTSYVAWDTSIRTSVSVARRIDVIGIAGGTGCSSVAADLATVISRRRAGRVLGVDAGLGAAFSRLVGAVSQSDADNQTVTEGGQAEPRLHAPMSVNMAAAETSHLLTGASELRVCRPGRFDAHTPPRPSEWMADAAPLIRFFDVVVTDWGHRLAGVDFEAALAGAHVVVLACRADRCHIEQAISVAQSVRELAPVTVCAVDVDGVGAASAHFASTQGLVPVEFIPHLSNPNTHVRPSGMRAAVIRLAAWLMSAATSSTSGGGL